MSALLPKLLNSPFFAWASLIGVAGFALAPMALVERTAAEVPAPRPEVIPDQVPRVPSCQVGDEDQPLPLDTWRRWMAFVAFVACEPSRERAEVIVTPSVNQTEVSVLLLGEPDRCIQRSIEDAGATIEADVERLDLRNPDGSWSCSFSFYAARQGGEE